MEIPIIKFDRVESVMGKAEELKDITPFAIVSKQMTGARGRFNKKWHALCEDNLHLSISFLPINFDYVKSCYVWFGIEICKMFQDMLPDLEFKVKWPNDIYCNGKKISGMAGSGAHIDQYNMIDKFILGLGLNVNTSLDTFPPIYRSLATSLKIEANKNFDMNVIARKIINSLHLGYEKAKKGANFKNEFDSLDYIKDKNTILPAKGIGKGINSDGYYEIKNNNKDFLVVSEDIILEGEDDLIKVLESTGCHFFCNYDL